jgi:hypothetical protein
MADYYQHQDRRAERAGARVHPRAHGDRTGVVLSGLAVLMLGVLALLWSSRETVVSPLPQPAAVGQLSWAAQVPAAPVAMRAAPAVTPPASYAVAAAGDTRPVQP